MLWTSSQLLGTNCQTTSLLCRCAKLPTLEVSTLLEMLFGFGAFKVSFFFSFTAGHHYLGCAAVLCGDFVCHNELALSQSVRILY